MRKLVLAACVAFVAAISASPSVSGAETAAAGSQPALYVRKLVLEQTKLPAGGTIHGTFELSNAGGAPAREAYYRVRLVGDYVRTLPSVVYDETALVGPYSIVAGGSQPIQFSYQLPAGLGGENLGVQIETLFKDGSTMGWSDARISVTGGSGFARVASSTLVVGEKRFQPQEGPTLFDGDVAKLALNVQGGSSVVSLAPVVSISPYGSLKPVKEFVAATTTIKASERKEIVVELPRFDKPGVYTGSLALVDADGVRRANVVSFRYIMAGTSASIKSIASSAEKAKAGELITLTVIYTGTPQDIAGAYDEAAVENGELSVVLLDGAGNEIGSGSKAISLSSAAKEAVVQVKALADSDYLAAKAAITKGGKELASLQSALSNGGKQTERQRPESGRAAPLLTLNKVLIALAAIALVAAAAYLIHALLKRRSHAPLAIIAVGVVSAATVFAVSGTAGRGLAYEYTYSGAYLNYVDGLSAPQFVACQSCGTFQIFLNSLKDTLGTDYALTTDGTYSVYVNEPFVVQGDWKYYACDNILSNPKIYYRATGESATTTITFAEAADNTTPASGFYSYLPSELRDKARFDLNPITFTSPGTKSISFFFKTDRDYNYDGPNSPYQTPPRGDYYSKCEITADQPHKIYKCKKPDNTYLTNCKDARSSTNKQRYLCGSSQNVVFDDVTSKCFMETGGVIHCVDNGNSTQNQYPVCWDKRTLSHPRDYLCTTNQSLTGSFQVKVVGKAPEVPALNVNPQACGNGAIDLVWSSSRATFFELYRDDAVKYSGTLTTFTDTGLGKASSHTYYVKAGNAYGTTTSDEITGVATSDCDLVYDKTANPPKGQLVEETDPANPEAKIKRFRSQITITIDTANTSSILDGEPTDYSIKCGNEASTEYSDTGQMSDQYTQECVYSTVGEKTVTVLATRKKGNKTYGSVQTVTVTVNDEEAPYVAPKCGAFDPVTGAPFDQTTSFQLVGKPVLWKITENALTGATYTWSGTDFAASQSGQGLTQVSKAYTIPGLKSVTLSDATTNPATTVACDAPTQLLIKPKPDPIAI